MTKYSPLTVFPIFVAVVVVIGVLFTLDTKNRYINQSLAQVHITDAPKIEPVPVTKDQKQLREPLTPLHYPDAIIISESTNSARLESMSDTTALTTWYKEKLTEMGFESKSFISANSKGNIENRFMATKGTTEIFIESKKPSGFIKAAINIELNPV